MEFSKKFTVQFLENYSFFTENGDKMAKSQTFGRNFWKWIDFKCLKSYAKPNLKIKCQQSSF